MKFFLKSTKPTPPTKFGSFLDVVLPLNLVDEQCKLGLNSLLLVKDSTRCYSLKRCFASQSRARAVQDMTQLAASRKTLSRIFSLVLVAIMILSSPWSPLVKILLLKMFILSSLLPRHALTIISKHSLVVGAPTSFMLIEDGGAILLMGAAILILAH